MTKQFHIVKKQEYSKLRHKDFSKFLLPLLVLTIGITVLGNNEVFAETRMADHTILSEKIVGENIEKIVVLGQPLRLQINGTFDYPYYIEETDDIIKAETGQGSVIFDKSTCSVSIYKPTTLFSLAKMDVKSDSWIVKRATFGNDNWVNVQAVNNAQCNASVIEDGNGNFEIVGVKTAPVGELKIRYIKEIDQLWKPQLEFTNLNNGWNNEKFAVIETIDFNDEIKGISNGFINNMTNFESNNFKYYVGEGKSQLWGMNKINSNKITIDYTNQTAIIPVGETLILDPVFGYEGSVHYWTNRSPTQASSTCEGVSTSSYFADSLWSHVWRWNSGYAGQSACKAITVYWDTSIIPNIANVSTVKISVDIPSTAGLNGAIREIEIYPIAMGTWNDNEVQKHHFKDAINGTKWLTNDAFLASTGNNKILTLGNGAEADLESHLVDNQWGVSFFYDSLTRDGVDRLTGICENGTYSSDCLALEVTYTIPLPESVTNLSYSFNETDTTYNITNNFIDESYNVFGEYILRDNTPIPFDLGQPVLFVPCDNNLDQLGTANSVGSMSQGTAKYSPAPNGLGCSNTQDTDEIIEFSNESEVDFLNEDDPWTISFWYKQTDDHFGTGAAVLSKGSAPGANPEFSINFNQDDLLAINLSAGSGDEFETACDWNGQLSTNQMWQHFTFTYTGGNDRSNLDCYVNGVLETRNGYGTSLSGSVLNNEVLQILGNDIYSSEGGVIDEIRIYDYGFNSTQVQSLYNYTYSSQYNYPDESTLGGTNNLYLWQTFDNKLLDQSTACYDTGGGGNGLYCGYDIEYGTNDPVFVNGQFGRAIYIDENLDLVSNHAENEVSNTFFPPEHINFERTDSFSLSGWINPSVTQTVDGVIFGKGVDFDIAGNEGWYVFLDTENKLCYKIKESAGNNTILLTCSETALPIDSWSHFVTTYNGTSKQSGMDIFIDNTLDVNSTTPYDLNNINFIDSYTSTPDDNSPQGIFFKPDGTKMYISGLQFDEVNQYDLSPIWDISSASNAGFMDLTTWVDQPTGLYFSPNGTLMYVVDQTNGEIDQFTLSDPWSVTGSEEFEEINEFPFGSGSDSPTTYRLYSQPLVVSSSCPETFWNYNNATSLFNQRSDTSGHCSRLLYNFNVTAVPDGSIITDVRINMTGTETKVNPHTISYGWIDDADPFTPDQGLWDDIDDDLLYAQAIGTTGTYVSDLGPTADSNVESRISSGGDIVSIGLMQNNNARISTDTGDIWNVDEIKLLISYQPPPISYNHTLKETAAGGVALNNNGTKMYITGQVSDSIHEYNLTTPYDVSSSVFVSSKNVNSQDSSPQGIFFKPDGTIMYMVGTQYNAINEYTLSDPWNITSASYIFNYTLVSEESTLTDLFIHPDGDEIYSLGYTIDVGEWDIVPDITSSILTDDLKPTIGDDGSGNFRIQGSYLDDFRIYNKVLSSSERNQLYTMSITEDVISSYIDSSITEPYTYNYTKYGVSLQGTSLKGNSIITAPAPDDTKSDSFSQTNQTSTTVELSANQTIADYGTIHGYYVDKWNGTHYLSEPYDVPPPIAYWKFDGKETGRTNYGMATIEPFEVQSHELYGSTNFGSGAKFSGNAFILPESSLETLNFFNVTDSYSVSAHIKHDTDNFRIPMYHAPTGGQQEGTGWRVASTSVATNSYTDNSNGLHCNWSIDGSSPFDNHYTWVYNGTISYEWDLTKLNHENGDYDPTQSDNTNGHHVSPDGLKLYVIDGTSDDLEEYTLSTAWDVSSASHINTNTLTEIANAWDVHFSTNGTKMFVTDLTNKDVTEYTLSTAWDISSASYVDEFTFGAETTNIRGMFFKDDGLKFYLTEGNTDKVHEYDLSNAWDVSTLSHLQSSSALSTDNPAPTDIWIKSDGLSLFVAGDGGVEILEYTLSTAWDITGLTKVNEIDVSADVLLNRGITLKEDGSKLILSGFDDGSNDAIMEYSISPYQCDNYDIYQNGKQLPFLSDNNNGILTKVEPNIPLHIGGLMNGDSKTVGNLGDGTIDELRIYDYALTQNQVWALSNYTAPTIDSNPYEHELLHLKFDGDVYDSAHGYNIKDIVGSENYTTGIINNAYDIETDDELIITENILDDNSDFSISAWVFVDGRVGTFVDTVAFSMGGTGNYKQEDWKIALANGGSGYGFACYKRTDSTTSDADFVVSSPIQNSTWYHVACVYDDSVANDQANLPTDALKIYVNGVLEDNIPADTNHEDGCLLTDTRFYGSESCLIFGADSTSIADFNGDIDDFRVFDSALTQGQVLELYKTEVETPWDWVDAETSVYNYKNLEGLYGLGLSTDGKKFYSTFTAGTDIREYDLLVPYNFNTLVDSGNRLDVAGVITSTPTTWYGGNWINPDGDKLYFMQRGEPSGMHEWTLSTPFDITSAGSHQLFYTSSQRNGTTDIAFSQDGTKFYTIVYTDEIVHEYTMSTPWNVSTASYTQGFDVAPTSYIATQAIDFKPDGTKLYVHEQLGNPDEILIFTLSTPWNVSTATYDGLFVPDTTLQSAAGHWQIKFNPNGEEFYTIVNYGGPDALYGVETTRIKGDILPLETRYIYPDESTLAGDDNLIAHWDFDYSLQDKTENNFNLVGNVTYVDSKFGMGTKITSSQQGALNVTYTGSEFDFIDTDTDWSIFYVVTTDEDYGNNGILKKRQNVGGGTGFNIINVNNPASGYINVYFQEDGSNFLTCNGPNVLPNIPTIITITYSGSSPATDCSGMNIYVNGVNSTIADTSTGSVNATNYATDLIVGGYGLSGLNDMEGTLDTLKIYNKVLTETEVLNLTNMIGFQNRTSLGTVFTTTQSPGTTETYRISAINGAGQGDGFAYNMSTLTDVPTSLTADYVSTSQIYLDWDAPTGDVNGYKIEEKINAGSWSTKVADTGNTDTTYLMTSLDSATLYTYRVSSLSAGGESPPSNEAFNYTIPEVPISPSATPVSSASDKINLQWTAPSGTIHGYLIERAIGAPSGWSVIEANYTGGTFYNDTGLLEQTTYFYRIASITNPVSPYSPPFNATTGNGPDAPLNVVATITDPDLDPLNILVSWDYPLDIGDNTVITGYDIIRSVNGGAWTSLVNDTAGLTYNDLSVSPGTMYAYSISSKGDVIDGNFSASSNNMTTPNIPNTPTSVTPTVPLPDTQPYQVSINWSNGDDNGSAISLYTIWRSTDDVTFVNITATTNKPYLDTVPSVPNATYYYKVQAKNGVGYSSNSTSNSVTISDIPTAPLSLTAIPRADHVSMYLDWMQPTDDGGSAINGYQIQININDAGWTTVVANTGNTITEYVDIGRTTNTNYKYAVYAINEVGGSPGSNVAQVEFTTAILSPVVTPLLGSAIKFDIDVNMTYGIPDSEIYDVELRYWSSGNLVTEVDPEPSVFVAKNGSANFTLYDNISETTDYYMNIKTTNGLSGEFSIFQTGKLTASPTLAFNSDIIGVEYRNESFNSSNLQIIGSEVKYDLVVVYKEFNNLDNVITLTWEDVISDVNVVVPVDPTKKYYILGYFKPTFDYTIGGSPINGNATIPVGYPVDLSLISMPDPNQVGFSLGIDVIAGESGIFGLPLVFIFIIALASIFTGRSAPMGIIFIAVALGFMAYMGLVDFNFDPANQSNTATWAIIIVAVIIGVMVGKRWD